MARPIQLHLDEPAGSSVFVNSGTVVGNFTAVGSPTAGVSGIEGNAVDFINDNVATRYLVSDPVFNLVEPTSFTLRAWVYLHAADVAGLHTHVVHKAVTPNTWSSPFTCAQIHILPNSTTPHFDVNNGVAGALGIDGPSLSLNTWHYLAMTYDAVAGVLTAYVDPSNGQPVGAVGGGVAINYGNHGQWMVGGAFANLETLIGVIDEVYLDDQVLNGGQLSAEYLRQPTPTPAPVAVPDLSTVQPVNTDFLVSSTTNDWVISGGDIKFAQVAPGNPGNPQGISQAVTIAVRTWVGEWFADLQAGLDWMTIFKNKKLDDGTIRAMITARVLSVPGTQGLTGYQFQRNNATRQYSVILSYNTIYGPVVGQVIPIPAGVT